MAKDLPRFAFAELRTIRGNIQRQLAAIHKSQAQLAHDIDMDKTHLNRILHGQRILTVAQLRNIAHALHRSLSEISADNFQEHDFAWCPTRDRDHVEVLNDRYTSANRYRKRIVGWYRDFPYCLMTPEVLAARTRSLLDEPNINSPAVRKLCDFGTRRYDQFADALSSTAALPQIEMHVCRQGFQKFLEREYPFNRCSDDAFAANLELLRRRLTSESCLKLRLVAGQRELTRDVVRFSTCVMEIAGAESFRWYTKDQAAPLLSEMKRLRPVNDDPLTMICNSLYRLEKGRGPKWKRSPLTAAP